MANPTGTVYLTAAPGYVWIDGTLAERKWSQQASLQAVSQIENVAEVLANG